MKQIPSEKADTTFYDDDIDEDLEDSSEEGVTAAGEATAERTDNGFGELLVNEYRFQGTKELDNGNIFYRCIKVELTFYIVY